MGTIERIVRRVRRMPPPPLTGRIITDQTPKHLQTGFNMAPADRYADMETFIGW